MEISNCTVSNTGSDGIRVENTATGYCKILTNDFSKINFNTGTGADVIDIASGATLSSLLNHQQHLSHRPAGLEGQFICEPQRV